ncbi:MAG TPA: HAMP domain-containing sensor histidine kinase [Gemmatimonadaceae bacterium]|nr:HAMP domain-containing sensor histidine kinase [Gemmatimonadaceae bacterium]
MKRSAPVVLLAVGMLALLGSYVWYTESVTRELQSDAALTSTMYARIYQAISDTTAGAADQALLELSQSIRELGVPVVITDSSGRITDDANVPGPAGGGGASEKEYVKSLDARNPPIVLPGSKQVHFGNTPFVRRARLIPLIQAALLAALVGAAVAVVRSRNRAERERVWAGMARESAHQLGTPLSSLHGWVELLREREGDPLVSRALPHMQGDLERLERVSHRFERIGRPAKAEPVDVTGAAATVVAYFSARVPTLACPITLTLESGHGALVVAGDRVLLEWAIESLVKNAIDALAGRGGKIVVRVEPVAGSGARVRVIDDGPGVPRELRSKIFSAGYTTKERGWGIGLALTRRIVEENHGGRLQLASSDRGAVFEITLPG